MLADWCRSLGRYSQAGRFRGPSSNSISEASEEWDRVDQPDPSRSPPSRSNLFGYAQQRSRSNRANSRMPDLEGNLHIAFLPLGRI